MFLYAHCHNCAFAVTFSPLEGNVVSCERVNHPEKVTGVESVPLSLVLVSPSVMFRCLYLQVKWLYMVLCFVSVTGSCFFVFSGALKAASGYLAKSSIVEGSIILVYLHLKLESYLTNHI